MSAQVSERVRKVLACQVSVARVIAVGIAYGTPYPLVATAWSMAHTEYLRQQRAVDTAGVFLGSIASR